MRVLLSIYPFAFLAIVVSALMTGPNPDQTPLGLGEKVMVEPDSVAQEYVDATKTIEFNPNDHTSTTRVVRPLATDDPE